MLKKILAMLGFADRSTDVVPATQPVASNPAPNPEVWRNDANSTFRPPPGSYTVCAEDVIGANGGLSLVICHVRSHEGEGFKPSVRIDGSEMRGGAFCPGTNAATLDLTRRQGMKLFHDAIGEELITDPPQPVIWRDDRALDARDEIATIHFCVICAKDFVRAKGRLELWINHVIGFHGKGFMFSVRYRGSGTMNNGGVQVGKGPDTYAETQTKGEEVLASEVAKMEARMQQHRETAT